MKEFILTFCYSGKAKFAPGTFGSVAAIAFWLVLTHLFCAAETSLNLQNIFWIIFLTAAFFYGVFASKSYASRFNEIDHPSIVLDEVVGQIIALQMGFSFYYQDYFSLKFLLLHLLVSFVLFRFFDIKKPLFIGYCDCNFKSGFGVMFDDLLSGIIAGILTIFILSIF